MIENNKKDYYFSVMLCQLILCILITLLVFLTGKNSAGLKEDFFSLLDKNLDGMEINTAIETIKNYQGFERLFSAFNQIESENNLNNYNGTGGEDLEYYEATKNTSFAPVFSTAEICPPIEKGRYTSYFGYRINPITGEYGFHTGLDIAAPEGTNIRAAFSGTVIKSGHDEKAGNYIYLEHNNGLVTFYCHCSEILAENGSNIRQGETIATVGSTGYSTGPHLHFEVRKDSIRYNPLWLLEK